MTPLRIRQQSLFVIDSDFFAGADVPEREEQNVAVQVLHKSIRFATVIDVVRAVPAATSVQTEAAVNIADPQKAALARAPPRFKIIDSLAGVFGDFATAFEMISCETTFAVYL